MKIFTLSFSLACVATINSCAPSATAPDSQVKITDEYPIAYFKKGSKTHVISPYKPHNLINVSHITPGHLARDTSTAKIDPKTKKPIESTGKIFRVAE